MTDRLAEIEARTKWGECPDKPGSEVATMLDVDYDWLIASVRTLRDMLRISDEWGHTLCGQIDELTVCVHELKTQAARFEEVYAVWHAQDMAWLKYEKLLVKRAVDEERAIVLRDAQNKSDKVLAVVERVCRATLAERDGGVSNG